MAVPNSSAKMSIADTKHQKLFHRSSHSADESSEVTTGTDVDSAAALDPVSDIASLGIDKPIDVGADAARHHRRSSISEENRIATWIPVHVPGCQHKWHQEHPPHKPLHRFPHHTMHHENLHTPSSTGYENVQNQSQTKNLSSNTDSAPDVNETCICSVMKWWPDPKSYGTF